MRKIILLVAIILTNLMIARSQNGFYIDPPSHDIEFSADASAQQSISTAYNNTSISRTFRWVLIVDQEPTGWINQVCDKNLCYAPGVITKDFVLGSDSSGLLRLDLTPNNVSGEGYFRLYVYDINDSANYNATMTVHAVSDPTGISVVSDQVISIYPIPAKEVLNLNLNGSKHITSVDINNIVGQKVKTMKLEEGLKTIAIPVSDLKKGVYFLRVFSNGNEVATKTFSKD
jgi:hypothetical protein